MIACFPVHCICRSDISASIIRKLGGRRSKLRCGAVNVVSLDSRRTAYLEVFGKYVHWTQRTKVLPNLDITTHMLTTSNISKNSLGYLIHISMSTSVTFIFSFGFPTLSARRKCLMDHLIGRLRFAILVVNGCREYCEEHFACCGRTVRQIVVSQTRY
jgi:hypothetical protein